MTPQRAVQVAEKLQDAFADVTVMGSRNPLEVVAREHTGRIPHIFCKHPLVLRACNVYIARKGAYLVSNPEAAFKVAEVRFCARCERIEYIENLN